MILFGVWDGRHNVDALRSFELSDLMLVGLDDNLISDSERSPLKLETRRAFSGYEKLLDGEYV